MSQDTKNIPFGKDIIDGVNNHTVSEINHQKANLFTVKTANEWLKEAKSTPIAQMLFGELWYENELCILFADANLGKSILAVQIADSISRGRQVAGFKMEAAKQPVLYFDFELSHKQFEIRYAIQDKVSKTCHDHYMFDDNLKRVEIDSDTQMPDNTSFEDFLNYSLEASIIEHHSKILIIDNITYLKDETEKSKHASQLMKHLKALKKKYGLSILALAHTPKRDSSKPISRNDLQGSKMLINFVDSCFAIGESFKDKRLRYLKQLKARNTQIIYDMDNVAIFEIQMPYNFLEFNFVGFGTEQEHLKPFSEKEKEDLVAQVKELHKQGLSQRKIADELKISIGAVNKYIKK
jgi:RecA-family ATPase